MEVVEGPKDLWLSPLRERLAYRVEEIPAWLREPNIRNGYRYNVSFSECIQSILYWHNNTICIWTHLIPCLIFIGLAVHIAAASRPQYNRNMSVRLCCSFAVVFGASAFMHTFNPINEDWHRTTVGLDWAGIAVAVMVGGSTLSELAYHKKPRQQSHWNIIFAVSCTIVAIVACSSRSFHGLPAWTKVSIFSLPGAAFLAFWYDVHKSLSKDDLDTMKKLFGRPTALMISGIVVYAAKFPESQFLEIDFSYSRGHHLYHHLWSSAFSFWFLRNTLEWAKKIHVKEKKLPL